MTTGNGNGDDGPPGPHDQEEGRHAATHDSGAPGGPSKSGKSSGTPGAAADPLQVEREAAAAEARELALAIAGVALDLKALNVEIIDVRGKVDYSDYVVVMSGRSDRQVAALARNIEATMDGKGVRCIGVEGMPQATWLLMDYGDVIVHIFHQDTRGYYDLETLWIDAARVEVEDREGPDAGGDPNRVRG